MHGLWGLKQVLHLDRFDLRLTKYIYYRNKVNKNKTELQVFLGIFTTATLNLSTDSNIGKVFDYKRRDSFFTRRPEGSFRIIHICLFFRARHAMNVKNQQ